MGEEGARAREPFARVATTGPYDSNWMELMARRAGPGIFGVKRVALAHGHDVRTEQLASSSTPRVRAVGLVIMTQKAASARAA